MTYAAFRSIGAYIPPKIMTNADFEKIMSIMQSRLLTKEKMHIITIDPKLSPNTIQITYG